MAIKTPTQAGDDYLTQLKALKPEVNTKQTDSDWWIRSRVVGGTAAGIYADQRLISNDALPTRARREAVARFLDLYFEGGFIDATQAVGNVAVTGNQGMTLTQGLQFSYLPNGNVYQSTQTIVLPAATGGQVSGLVPVRSVAAGQEQNLLAGAPLTVSSPPIGLNSSAIVDEDGLADARNPESTAEARARIVTRIREPLGVGRESDYIQYARAADPSVVSASVIRYPFGLGTVAVYITSGTTDIDAAVDEGIPISVIPSDELVAIVQEFLEVNRPVTDCVTVLKPVAVTQDATVMVKFSHGDMNTILSGQTLTQGELVAREVSRAIYKTPVGGRRIGVSGFVVASEMEQTIDAKLSNETVVVGAIPIITDRQVLPLSVSGYNRGLLPSEVPVPGTITVIPWSPL
jgi:uncharacterized phage protein gp47/JayE